MRLLFLSLLLITQLSASVLKVGDRFPDIVLPDQFGEETRIEPDDKTILLAFEKKVSVKINEFLKARPATFLDEHACRYISDISSMPSLVTKVFVLPKMKDYPFKLLLIHDDIGEMFEREEGKISLYSLDQGVVRSIRFITGEELPDVFDADRPR